MRPAAPRHATYTGGGGGPCPARLTAGTRNDLIDHRPETCNVPVWAAASARFLFSFRAALHTVERSRLVATPASPTFITSLHDYSYNVHSTIYSYRL